MTASDSNSKTQSILIIGASRGLGFAMADEFLKQGFQVMGTVRAGSKSTPLHELADRSVARLEIETVDINEPEQVTALHQRLIGRRFDILFVNAGTTNENQDDFVGNVSTEEFIRVMVTNTLSPMRVVESLQDCVSESGLIGIMSSGQGSVTNNTNGMREVYRSSKAALNQAMRSYAARTKESKRALVLMAPGWVKTDLGGPDAPLTIEDSIPSLVQVLIEKQSRTGLEYLNYKGETVSW